MRKRHKISNNKKSSHRKGSKSSLIRGKEKLEVNIKERSLRRKRRLKLRNKRSCRWKCLKWNLSRSYKILKPYRNKLIKNWKMF